MRREDWSRAAHGDLEFMGPYDASSFAELFEGIALPPGAHVLDLGCGNGALLAWLAARGPIAGTGVDLRPAARSIPGVELVAGDAREFDAPPVSYDLACSVGAVSSAGELARLTRPGGLVVLGDGYWRQPPSAGYLAALGASRDELDDWDATLARGEGAGLELVRARASTVEEWDRYEDVWAANGERYAAAHEGEPGVGEFLAWIRAGRRRYRELGGRETLGFVLLLLRTP